MKASFFQQPLEFKILINGEKWSQGEKVSGSLAVKNHGKESQSIADLKIVLAHGLSKLVKKKSTLTNEAFSSVTESKLNEISIPAGSVSEPIEWSFQLEANSPITDKSGSLYILYGRGEELSMMGHLEIEILPRQLFLEFIDMMSTRFRFKINYQKAKKDQVEFKLVPPDSKNFASIEHLNLFVKMNGENIESKLSFHVKKIDLDASEMTMKKIKKDFELNYTPKEYLLFNGHFNKDMAEESIKAVLEEVKTGF